jgi:ABC-type Fe3+/spermidine/putrescine transport system ATPase subunit
MAAVELKGIAKSFGDVQAVKQVDLSFEEGTFTTLLGPSGCGKTTILRMVAGLETPSAGDILIKGNRVNDVPIHRRNLGLVFQNYALFPHKTIEQNVAFGLKYRGVEKAEMSRRVKQALDIVRLPGVERRLPAQLSGGQQQRIALARAIVIEPDVLLLDEPLSALDANLREEMRVELKAIQRNIGITTIFVTHDQEEALSMSDNVVVMDHGVVEQVGAPDEVYRWPETRFVADFLGHSNIMKGKTEATANGQAEVRLENGLTVRAATGVAATGTEVEVVVRAHKVAVGAPEGEGPGGAGMNIFPGTVRDVNYLGGTASYHIDVSGLTMQAINAIEGPLFEEGAAVSLRIATGDCVLLDARGRRID